MLSPLLARPEGGESPWPNLLGFDEDLQAWRDAENQLLLALACHGLGDKQSARQALESCLAFNRADQRAVELLAECQGA